MRGIIIIYVCTPVLEGIQVETKFIFLYTRVLCYNTVVYMLVFDEKKKLRAKRILTAPLNTSLYPCTNLSRRIGLVRRILLHETRDEPGCLIIHDHIAIGIPACLHLVTRPSPRQVDMFTLWCHQRPALKILLLVVLQLLLLNPFGVMSCAVLGVFVPEFIENAGRKRSILQRGHPSGRLNFHP